MRLRGYHYGAGGSYFVTVCIRDRAPVLATITDNRSHLSPLGMVIQRQWSAIPSRDPAIHLDESVIMPDHLHGILTFDSQAQVTLPSIMAWFKGTALVAAREARLWGSAPLWQRGYHDRVVRDLPEMDQIRSYIHANPMRWALRPAHP